MAEPLKKDEALAAAVREAFQRHMENARLAAEALKEKQAASTAQRSTAPLPRDLRLTVPKPANETSSIRAEEKAVSPSSATNLASPSLGRLVSLASPPKPQAPAPEIPVPEIEAKPVLSPEPTPSAPAAEVAPDEASGETVADSSFDFGEALFIEIAPEIEKKAQDEPPKMPKAASLDTPPLDGPSQEATEVLEFRGPPSRERPRMSTASATATAPEDLDLRIESSSNPAQTAILAPPSAVVEDKTPTTAPNVQARRTTRFGVSSAANANEARGSARTWARIKIPPALIASALLAAGIAMVGAYFWANPDKLQSLGALVAPPAASPPETKVAAVPPPVSAPAPAPSVNEPAQAATPAQAPAPAPASSGATRSVSTVAITVDEVDQAVQAARELLAMGDVLAAREELESYRAGNDPRALFALAETYDPAIAKGATQSDAAQAKVLYEAAAKAGSQDTADRIARLALVHAN